MTVIPSRWFAWALFLSPALIAPTSHAETRTVPLNQSLQSQESYAALNLGTTRIVGKTASHLSLAGTWLFNDGLSFGLYLDSLLAQHVESEERYNLRDVTLWHTGVSIGWQQPVVGPILMRLQVKGGVGQFTYRDTQDEEAKTETAHLGVISPEAAVLIQVTEDLRLGLSGAYRFSSKPRMAHDLSVGAKALSAPVVGLELSLRMD